MKQTVVLALVAFLAAVGGGTWFAAFLAPPAKPPVTVAAARSFEPGPRFVPPTAGKSKPADSTAARGDRSKPKPGPAGAPGSRAAADSNGASRPAPAPVDSAALIRGAKSVAKVVASMKPKDAVGILGKLSDEEVERIVRQMNPKQIAALLTVFPQERAAGLSRKLLGPRA